jgi:hypothetical protein
LLQTRFQLLSCQVVIDYQDPALEKHFSYLAVNARQTVAVTRTLSYRVSGKNAPYQVFQDGDFMAGGATPEDALFHVYRRVYQRVLERYMLAGWALFHAGLASIEGKCFLFLGNKGAGKTTLVTRLLMAGHPFEGDEMVVARGKDVLAVPRRLHLKPGIEKQVPELRPYLDGLPTARAGELDIRGLDPTFLGFDWNISARKADHIVWLSPNHGGNTELQSLSSFAMIQRLLESYFGWGQSKNRVVKCAAELAKNGGHQLILGEPKAAMSQLQTLAESAP